MYDIKDKKYYVNEKGSKDYPLTDAQYRILMAFHQEFNAFCRGPRFEYYLPELFIDTPEWTKITERAKEVLKAFNYKKE